MPPLQFDNQLSTNTRSLYWQQDTGYRQLTQHSSDIGLLTLPIHDV
jgi:hypothetical protein